MITEEQVEEALELLAETAEEYGGLAGAMKSADDKIKYVEAYHFDSDAKGAVDTKRLVARKHPDFKKAVDDKETVTAEYTILYAKREHARTLISVYQSMKKAGGNEIY